MKDIKIVILNRDRLYPLIQQINVHKHISLHSGFFENKIECANKLKNFFGSGFELPANEFASIFIHKQ